MKAIQDIRRYLGTHRDTPPAAFLARLPDQLYREEGLALADLYALDWDSFELAIELLRDWRIDRYYAEQTDLFPQEAKVPVSEPLPATAPLEQGAAE